MKTSWFVWAIGFIYGLAETAYFGWNAMPASPAEILADGITGVIFALGLVTSAIENK